MKILVISGYPNPVNENAWIFVEEQIRELVKQDCQIKVVSPVPYSPFPFNKISVRWSEYSRIPLMELRNEIEVYYPRYFQFPVSLAGDLIGYNLLYIQGQFLYWGLKGIANKIFRDFKPQIIHVHRVFPHGYAVSLLKKNLNQNIKTVLTIHGSDINVTPFKNSLIRNRIKSSLNDHDAVIAVSQSLSNIAVSISGRSQIRVIPNGVDIKKFTLSDEDKNWVKEKKNEFKGKKVILFVGSIRKEKGIIELLKAFTEINLYRKDLILLLVGKVMIERDYLDYFIKQGEIKVIGPVKHAEVKLWMNLCDVFVLPSYSEGLPVSMLEAMSCSRPVVVSDVGGVGEVIRDRENGLLVKPGDVKSLIEAMEFLLSNPDKAKILGEEGKKTILRNYTWNRNAKNTIEVYKSVLES